VIREPARVPAVDRDLHPDRADVGDRVEDAVEIADAADRQRRLHQAHAAVAGRDRRGEGEEPGPGMTPREPRP